MVKRKSIFGLVLCLGLLFSMNSIQENTSANAGWAIAKYALNDNDAAQAGLQAAGGVLGAGAAAWYGAQEGAKWGAFVGGPWGMAIGAGLGAL